MPDMLQSTDAEQLELSFADQQRTLTCGSCGAPISVRELCAACERAFSSVLAHSPASVPEPFLAEPQVEARRSEPQPLDTAPPQIEAIDETPAAETPVLASFGSPPPSGPVASKPAARNRAALLTVAVVVVVAMVGFPIGARWLEGQLHSATATATAGAPEKPAHPREQPPRRAKPSAAARVEAEHANKPRTPAPVAPTVARVARPQPAASKIVRSVVPAKNVRPASAIIGAAAPVIANASAEVAPIAPPLPPSPPPPVIETTNVAAQPPVGRLFQSSDVDEAPRIATRVEPELPTAVAERGSDVVVVRILVSHTGHPFRVNLLRRSWLGANVDEAVLAAVKRWTFSPARRHGEAVSCWYNFGVAVRAE